MNEFISHKGIDIYLAENYLECPKTREILEALDYMNKESAKYMSDIAAQEQVKKDLLKEIEETKETVQVLYKLWAEASPEDKTQTEIDLEKTVRYKKYLEEKVNLKSVRPIWARPGYVNKFQDYWDRAREGKVKGIKYFKFPRPFNFCRHTKEGSVVWCSFYKTWIPCRDRLGEPTFRSAKCRDNPGFEYYSKEGDKETVKWDKIGLRYLKKLLVEREYRFTYHRNPLKKWDPKYLKLPRYYSWHDCLDGSTKVHLEHFLTAVYIEHLKKQAKVKPPMHYKIPTQEVLDSLNEECTMQPPVYKPTPAEENLGVGLMLLLVVGFTFLVFILIYLTPA